MYTGMLITDLIRIAADILARNGNLTVLASENQHIRVHVEDIGGPGETNTTYMFIDADAGDAQ